MKFLNKTLSKEKRWEFFKRLFHLNIIILLSQVWNNEYVTCESHRWMKLMIICYMRTIWMKMMMRLWFSIYIYVICALYEQDDETILNVCFMFITQSYVPQYHNAMIRILCCWWWVARQPHQKCGAIGQGSSPRELPNPAALPCDDRMSLWVLRNRSYGRAQHAPYCSW